MRYDKCMQPTSLPCNLVLLPEPALAERAMQLSQRLAHHGTYFTLKHGEYFPHLSLYMTQLKIDDLPRVSALLEEIAAQNQRLTLSASDYNQSFGFIDVAYARTTALDSLQASVIETINPIRDGMRQRDKARLQTAKGLTLHNLQTYGYSYVGELFRPHITITRLTRDGEISTEGLPLVASFSGAFPKLGLFEMGDHGTCVRKIAEFVL